MQIESLFIALIMIIIIPIIIISSDHNAFFFITGFIVIISSILNLNKNISNSSKVVYDENHDSIDEFEELLNIDVKKFGIGLKFVKNLFIILFILYCIFFITSIFIKIFAVIVISYWLQDCLNLFSDINSKSTIKIFPWYHKYIFTVVNISSLIVVFNVIYFKIIS